MITGRIFDRLVAHFGRESVFRDIDNIPFGVDFRTHVSATLAASDVVLAIVGPRWIGPRPNHSRLVNEADPVRVEIEAVLRKGAPLIPVLVFRATMPRADQLPASIRDFAYRNAIQVDDGQDFDVHMARLIRALDVMVQGGNAPPVLVPDEPEPNSGMAERRPGFGTSATPGTLDRSGAASPGAAHVSGGSPRGSGRRGGLLSTVGAITAAAVVLGGVAWQRWDASPVQRDLPKAGVNRDYGDRAETGPRRELKTMEQQQNQEIAQKEAAAQLQRQAEAERVRQAEAQRQRQAEAERLKQVEAERQQRADAADRDQRTYAAAKGDLASLRAYVSTCTVCAFATEARGEIAKLETAAQEEQSYTSSRGNLYALRSYLNTCRACAFQSAAREEIARLETAAQEEQTYSSARGNLTALRSYLNTCRACSFASAARDEIAKLEFVPPKQRTGSTVLCGRSVDYVVDTIGVVDALRAYLGVWSGAAWNSRICGGLIVEGADSDGTAKIKYVYGPTPGSQFPWKLQRRAGLFRFGELSFTDEDGGVFTFRFDRFDRFDRFEGQNVLHGNFTSKSGGKLEATLTRELASLP